jgi:putative protease
MAKKKKTKMKKTRTTRMKRKTRKTTKAKKIKKSKTTKKSKKSSAKKKMSKKRTRAIAKAVSSAKEKLIGKVIHFYDRIGVAIVDLKSPLKIGETVMLKKGDLELTQRIDSMQIEHQPVMQAKKGDIIGVKVDRPVHEGTLVMPA